MTSQFPAGSVVPAIIVRDLTVAAKGMQFDDKNALRASSQLGKAMGARYIVVTKIDKFSFAERAILTNEYTIRMTTMILDCQQARIIATVPTICIKSPWMKDSNLAFTDYFERMILPDFCKKVSQDIARKIPVR